MSRANVGRLVALAALLGAIGTGCSGRAYPVYPADAGRDGKDAAEAPSKEVSPEVPTDMASPGESPDAVVPADTGTDSPADSIEVGPVYDASDAADSPSGPAMSDARDAFTDGGASGKACERASDCTSNSCHEGVCCDSPCTGTCQSCLNTNTGKPDGTCAPVKSGLSHGSDCTAADPTTCGLDGKCDGAGACRKFGSDTVCRGESCSLVTNSYSATSKCDGKGTCAPQSQSCGNYKCTQDGVRCRASCTADTDCASNAFCQDKFCFPKLSVSAVCSRSEQCTSTLCGGRCCKPGEPCKCTQPSAGNLFRNAGFDKDLSEWEIFTGNWSNADAESCPFSGSLNSPYASGEPRQCVRVAPNVLYNFGFSVFLRSSAGFTCQIRQYKDSECQQASGNDASLPLDPSIALNVWVKVSMTILTGDNAWSASLDCDVPDANIDQLYLTPAPGRF